MVPTRCDPLSFEGGPQSEDRPPAKQCVTRTLTTARARAVHGYSKTVIVFVVGCTRRRGPSQLAVPYESAVPVFL